MTQTSKTASIAVKKQKQKARSRKHYLAHKQEYLQRGRKYREVNSMKLKEYGKKYREKNRANFKAYRESKKDSIKRRNKENYQRIRVEWMKIIKSLNYDRCSTCGYDKCFAAIEFHHLNRANKEFNMGWSMARLPTPEAIEELKKTIPLCANCHRELHNEFIRGNGLHGYGKNEQLEFEFGTYIK